MEYKMTQTDNHDPVVKDLRTHYLVGAGAGTGKTYLLTHRYAHAVVEGTSPHRMLAVTFTRKAAAEMRDRIRTVLRQEVGKNESIRGSIEQLQTAWIDTFHGFCAALLKSFPVEAKVDPEFELVEPAASRTALDETVGSFLEEVLKSEGHEIRKDLVKLLESFSFKDIRAAVAALRSEPTFHADSNVWESLDRKVAQFYAQHPLLIKLWPERWKNERFDNAGLQNINDAVSNFRNNPTCGNWNSLLSFRGTPLQHEGMENFRVIKDYFRHDRPEHSPGIIEKNKAVSQSKAMSILEILNNIAFYSAFPSHLEAGQLDYDALERRTLDFLRNQDNRKAVGETLALDHIFVDEYQDTNDCQRRILYFLLGCEDPDAPHLKFPEKCPRFFAVGDPKQSIFRFRGAQVEVFARTREHIGNSGGCVSHELTVNRRSSNQLREFFNELFNGSTGIFSTFKDTPAADYEPSYTKADPPEEQKPENDLCKIGCCIFDDKTQNDYSSQSNDSEDDLSKHTREAEWIAGQIAALLAGDESGKKWSRSDIVILRNSVRNVSSLQQALAERDIRSYVVGSRTLFDCQEIRDIIQWVKWLATPDDDLALVCCAKQPWIGFTDRMLLTLQQCQEDDLELYDMSMDLKISDCARSLSAKLRLLRLKKDSNQINPCLERLRAFLTELRFLAGRIPADQLLDKIVSINRMRETWAALDSLSANGSLGRSEQIVGNIERFLELARENWSGITDLKELQQRIESQKDAPEGTEEAQLLSENENVVRIMTIHQAKGLEFPVVFVSALENIGTPGKDSAVLQVKDGMPLLKIPDSQLPLDLKLLDPVSVYAKKIDDIKHLAEKKRLLYVALTRAQTKLFISGTIGSKSRSPFGQDHDFHSLRDPAQWIAKYFNMSPASDGTRKVGLNSPAAQKWFSSGLKESEKTDTADSKIQEITEPVSESTKELKMVSSVVLDGQWRQVTPVNPSRTETIPCHLRVEDNWIPMAIFPNKPSADKETSLARQYGDLVHDFFARWDFDDGSKDLLMDDRCRAWFEESKMQRDARAFLKHCVDNFCGMRWKDDRLAEIFRSAFKEKRVYREWPFMHVLDRNDGDNDAYWVSGSIDVVLKDVSGTYQIFDYKTGKENPEHYASQLSLYASALKATLQVNECVTPRPILVYLETKPTLKV
jgi:ATP-dependent helicase/nuclease subunit A